MNIKINHSCGSIQGPTFAGQLRFPPLDKKDALVRAAEKDKYDTEISIEYTTHSTSVQSVVNNKYNCVVGGEAMPCRSFHLDYMHPLLNQQSIFR